MKFKTPDEVLDWLDAMPMFSKKGSDAVRFGLQRFMEFCEAIGSPHKGFKSIHVAGTNGKGSVCHMLAAGLQHAGLRVGLYTSPHLIDYRERVVINGQTIGDESFLEFFNTFYGRIVAFDLSYFEISTGLAYWFFAKDAVDIAIIETGLGGRLDATNIIEPELSIITSIGFDHTAILGNTLPKIAGEKAGIIKQNRPVVISNSISGDTRAVIEARAVQVNAPKLGPEPFPMTGQIAELYHDAAFASNLESVQTALGFLSKSESFDIQRAEQGIVRLFEQGGIPGRMERLIPEKNWFFDGAHNAESLKMLVQRLKRSFHLGDAVVVLSLMADKLSPEVIDLVSEFGEILYYQIGSQRALPDAEFLAKVGKNAHVLEEAGIPNRL